MADPHQFLSQSDSGKSVASRSKALLDTMMSKVRYPSSHTSRKNSAVMGQSSFDPPLEAVSSPNHMLYFKRGADPVHTDYAALLVKNKSLQTEVRNLQTRLLTKETSLQEMKSELENYKENNAIQSSQILSLKDHIRDLEEINASATRIKSLKNASIQNLEKGNWDLSERVAELESRLRVQLVEREKAEQKAASLEKKLVDATYKLASFMNLEVKGPDDPFEVLGMKDSDEAFLSKNLERENILIDKMKNGQKVWDKCQHDSLYKEKQMSIIDQTPFTFNWETKTTQTQYQSFINQLATLLSNTLITVPATEEAVRERIQEISTNEQTWNYKTDVFQQEIQLLTRQIEQLHQLYQEAVCDSSQTEEKHLEQKKSLKLWEQIGATDDFFQGKWDFDKKKGENQRGKNQMKTSQTEEFGKRARQLEKEKRQQILLNIEKSLQNSTTGRLEEKVEKLEKELSEMKLSNHKMKTQLMRVNDLKDKTIEKLQKSLKRVETIKEKATKKAVNLKTTLDYTEQEAREEKEMAYQMLEAVTNELYTVKRALEEVVRREKQLMDFRESIMKMMGFNIKIPDKEIINQLKPIIQAYEISLITSSSRSKVGDCKTGHENE
ncbi:coiled-coil domain-containing protein 170 [Sarcophilus harrisii]|uniref:Coiled-coil domain containing 170 n=1 Tax=Sarcophilus harrisii TaxID=9305 RepID=G3VEQ2_SARHA|nr:coiled-coil domain-containing protein 170 [Sarcophilus harrisii]XP_031808562.1 coiled-coil domain-containing protein 170 [Sarcophilus harrisii]